MERKILLQKVIKENQFITYADGNMRQPSLKCIRDDKAPHGCILIGYI